MKVIAAGRRAGKTYKMIQALNKNPDSLLWVFSESEKARLVREYKIKPERIFTPSDLELEKQTLRGFYWRGKTRPVFIDNADTILRQLLPPGFSACVMTVTLDESL